MKGKTIRHVAIVLSLEYASSRDMLSGISDYVRGRCLWRIKVLARTGTLVQDILNHRFDGLIVNEDTAYELASRLSTATIPVVVLGNPENFPSKPPQNVVFVHNDNQRIGRFGARYLSSLGKFRSFAFLPMEEDYIWSRQRFLGFKSVLSARSPKVLTPGRDESLPDFLAALPKPAALMAACDARAAEAVSACDDLGIRIPRQISLLGVDNDELLCNLSDPTLSSITPDHKHIGHIAAQSLDRMLRAKTAGDTADIVCPNLKITIRESTVATSVSAYVVDKALEFIRTNATRNLTVGDVAMHLGISQPLAYLRFREANAGTIADAIAAARLGEVARRLRASHVSISNIAEQCSFANLQHLANAFKRHYGVTMSAYRAGSS